MLPVEVPADAVLPSSQVGEHGIDHASHLRYVRSYTLRTAYEAADAVCCVTVKNWLGENDAATYYEAEVDKLYKGDIPQFITLYQIGKQKAQVSAWKMKRTLIKSIQ